MQGNCCNCGAPMVIDEVGGVPYMEEPAGYAPEAPQGGALPSPAVSLPNFPAKNDPKGPAARIVHHATCPVADQQG